MSSQTGGADQLPSFEEFIQPSLPPMFEQAASRLEPHIEAIDTDAVAEFYIDEIPGESVDAKAEQLAHNLPTIDRGYTVDLFDHEALNAVYGLSHQVNDDRTEAWVPTDLLDHQMESVSYDNIVLDHSPVCRILADESYKYTTRDGEERHFDAADLTAFIDHLADTDVDLFIPSDLRDKYERPGLYASADNVPIQHAMIDHLEEVAMPYEIDRSVDVPEAYDEMVEDYGIGSAADAMSGETAVLAFDGDFAMIEDEYDVDAVIPPLPEY